jgi:hypothetical protein
MKGHQGPQYIELSIVQERTTAFYLSYNILLLFKCLIPCNDILLKQILSLTQVLTLDTSILYQLVQYQLGYNSRSVFLSSVLYSFLFVLMSSAPLIQVNVTLVVRPPGHTRGKNISSVN